MKFPDRYAFPAVFTYEEGQEIAVVFPDLDVATSGENDADALASARELLGMVLAGMEEDGEEIPAPSALKDVDHEMNECTALIDVYMPAVRLAHETRAVSRTVTIPAWLNAKAQENGINFSATLQEALKAQLGY